MTTYAFHHMVINYRAVLPQPTQSFLLTTAVPRWPTRAQH